MQHLIQDLIQQLSAVQGGQVWMGQTFDRLLDGITAETAFKRPIEDMHSVAEIISHLTLWREETILKIKTGQGSKTDDCPENWRSNAVLQAIGWPALKAAYDQSLIELIALLDSKTDAFLDVLYDDPDFGGKYPYRFVLQGMLHHDIYHLGQLGLVMKFLKTR